MHLLILNRMVLEQVIIGQFLITGHRVPRPEVTYSLNVVVIDYWISGKQAETGPIPREAARTGLK